MAITKLERMKLGEGNLPVYNPRIIIADNYNTLVDKINETIDEVPGGTNDLSDRVDVVEADVDTLQSTMIIEQNNIDKSQIYTLTLQEQLVELYAKVAELQQQQNTINEVTLVGTYYFAANGDDGAAGTIDAPFKTMAKLESLALVAGDVVLFRLGYYQ